MFTSISDSWSTLVSNLLLLQEEESSSNLVKGEPEIDNKWKCSPEHIYFLNIRSSYIISFDWVQERRIISRSAAGNQAYVSSVHPLLYIHLSRSEIEAKVIMPSFRVWYITTIADLEMIRRRVIVSNKGGKCGLIELICRRFFCGCGGVYKSKVLKKYRCVSQLFSDTSFLGYDWTWQLEECTGTSFLRREPWERGRMLCSARGASASHVINLLLWRQIFILFGAQRTKPNLNIYVRKEKKLSLWEGKRLYWSLHWK